MGNLKLYPYDDPSEGSDPAGEMAERAAEDQPGRFVVSLEFILACPVGLTSAKHYARELLDMARHHHAVTAMLCSVGSIERLDDETEEAL